MLHIRPFKKYTCLASPPASFLGAASYFFLFVIFYFYFFEKFCLKEKNMKNTAKMALFLILKK